MPYLSRLGPFETPPSLALTPQPVDFSPAPSGDSGADPVRVAEILPERRELATPAHSAPPERATRVAAQREELRTEGLPAEQRQGWATPFNQTVSEMLYARITPYSYFHSVRKLLTVTSRPIRRTTREDLWRLYLGLPIASDDFIRPTAARPNHRAELDLVYGFAPDPMVDRLYVATLYAAWREGQMDASRRTLIRDNGSGWGAMRSHTGTIAFDPPRVTYYDVWNFHVPPTFLSEQRGALPLLESIARPFGVENSIRALREMLASGEQLDIAQVYGRPVVLYGEIPFDPAVQETIYEKEHELRELLNLGHAEGDTPWTYAYAPSFYAGMYFMSGQPAEAHPTILELAQLDPRFEELAIALALDGPIDPERFGPVLERSDSRGLPRLKMRIETALRSANPGEALEWLALPGISLNASLLSTLRPLDDSDRFPALLPSHADHDDFEVYETETLHIVINEGSDGALGISEVRSR
ncbi:MAG: hypothetical protein AAFU77_16655 [Myxococcota bacterium]